MRPAISVLPALAACSPVPVSPVRMAEICEHRAKGAQGLTCGVTIKANRNSGSLGLLTIGLNSEPIRPQLLH